MSRASATLFVLVTASILLTACSSSGSSSGPGGETTCTEWLSFDNEVSAYDRIYNGKENPTQKEILNRMLSAHGYGTDEYSRTQASFFIFQFCYSADTGMRQNDNQPIEGAIDW